MEFNLISDMFPQYLKNTEISKEDNKITLYFESTRSCYSCPKCGISSKVISTYFNRTLQDLSIIEKALFLKIRLQKFRCKNPNCKCQIFSESIAELADTKARRTRRLNDLLLRLAFTSSSEKASRICRENNIVISGDTLLRLCKQWQYQIDPITVTAVAIDDFALKKIINMEP